MNGTNPPNKVPPVEIGCSQEFIPWLQEQRISLAFTSHQANRLFLLGLKPDGVLSLFDRVFNGARGLYQEGDRLWLAASYQIWRLENVLSDGQTYNDYDRLYVPRVGYTTGNIGLGDLGIDRNGKLIFANSLYSCVATLSDRHSFTPLWKPPFISDIVAEDRCHLKGLALINGLPRYATAFSTTDEQLGWQKKANGCLIDLEQNTIVLEGLSMPRSPRWYGDRLWLLESGSGYFGYLDLQKGKFEPVIFCPGYGRGLIFYQEWVIISLSKTRTDTEAKALKLNQQIEEQGVKPLCGLAIINLKTGNLDHWLQIEGVITELNDVEILPGTVCPMSLGFLTDEISRIISIESPPSPEAPPPLVESSISTNPPIVQVPPPPLPSNPVITKEPFPPAPKPTVSPRNTPTPKTPSPAPKPTEKPIPDAPSPAPKPTVSPNNTPSLKTPPPAPKPKGNPISDAPNPGAIFPHLDDELER